MVLTIPRGNTDEFSLEWMFREIWRRWNFLTVFLLSGSTAASASKEMRGNNISNRKSLTRRLLTNDSALRCQIARLKWSFSFSRLLERETSIKASIEQHCVFAADVSLQGINTKRLCLEVNDGVLIDQKFNYTIAKMRGVPRNLCSHFLIRISREKIICVTLKGS